MQVQAEVLVNYLNRFESSSDIADYFISIGVTGYRQDESSCPIARWLNNRLDCSVNVEDKVTVFTSDSVYDEGIVFDLSDSAKDFIDKFDSGVWPQLDADYCDCGECEYH